MLTVTSYLLQGFDEVPNHTGELTSTSLLTLLYRLLSLHLYLRPDGLLFVSHNNNLVPRRQTFWNLFPSGVGSVQSNSHSNKLVSRAFGGICSRAAWGLSSPTVIAATSFPDAKPFQTHSREAFHPALLAYYNDSNGGRTTRGGQRQRKPMKNDRDRNTLIIGHRLRVHKRFPPKFEWRHGCQPIKLEHFQVTRYWRTRCRRVYKASPVLPKSFGLGLAPVRLS